VVLGKSACGSWASGGLGLCTSSYQVSKSDTLSRSGATILDDTHSTPAPDAMLMIVVCVVFVFAIFG
jgi:hypothetical protein